MSVAELEAELAAIALDEYPPTTCPTADCKGRKVEARFATRDEQIELSSGRVPTVVWHCDACRWTRKEITMDFRHYELVAAACHMANRAVCLAQGDTSQPAWEDAPEWQRHSAVDGVREALKGATPEKLHESWCAFKRETGWKYGATKDAEAKTHPCLVPYGDLPEGQKLKDAVFVATVHSLAKVLELR